MVFFFSFFSFLVCLFTWLIWVLVEAHGMFVASSGSFVAARGLSSCGVYAQLFLVVWDLGSQTRDRTQLPCIARQNLNHWTTGKSLSFFLMLIFSKL